MNIRNVTVLGSLIFSGVLALGACGSSSSSGTGGTTGSLGGTTGSLGGTTGSAGGHVGSVGGTTGTAGGHVGSVGGSTGTATGGTTGSCPNIPHCLTALVNCLPSGTCTSQSGGSALDGTFSTSECYSNGVKDVVAEAIDLTSGSITITATVSKGAGLCYTEVITESGAGGASGAATDATITIKNAQGAVIGTLIPSTDGTTDMFLCAGDSAPLPLPSDCGMTNTSTSDCTEGVCQ